MKKGYVVAWTECDPDTNLTHGIVDNNVFSTREDAEAGLKASIKEYVEFFNHTEESVEHDIGSDEWTFCDCTNRVCKWRIVSVSIW